MVRLYGNDPRFDGTKFLNHSSRGRQFGIGFAPPLLFLGILQLLGILDPLSKLSLPLVFLGIFRSAEKPQRIPKWELEAQEIRNLKPRSKVQGLPD